MSDPDPDALWKPGYRGTWHTPAPGAAGGDRGDGAAPRGARRALVGVAVAAAVALGLVVWSTARDDADPADPRAPTASPAGWTVTLATTRIGAVTATDEVVLALVDRPGSLVALERADGSERWRRPASGAAASGLDVIDGAVLARHVEADGGGSVVAYDAATGVPLWDGVLAPGEQIHVFAEAALRVTPDGAVRVDPRTGERIALVGTTGPPGDNVVRVLAPGEPRRIDLGDAVVTVVVDLAADQVTITYEPL